MRRAFHIALDAYWRFLVDDGWAIASHIALSALMAMFPFFIVLTSLAGFFGSGDLADEVAKLMLATWPDEVAGPIAREIQSVLTTTHPGALTLGAAFAIYFASSGVESLRIGLNRAYGVVETRYWILLRLESDRLCAGGRAGIAGARVSDRAGAAPVPHRPALCALARAARGHLHHLSLRHCGRRSHHRAVRRPQVVAGRTPSDDRDPARHHRHADLVAHRRRRLRPLSRRVLVRLCELLCRARLGHDRAGVPLLDGIDLRLWRCAQCRVVSAAASRTHRTGRQRRTAH